MFSRMMKNITILAISLFIFSLVLAPTRAGAGSGDTRAEETRVRIMTNYGLIELELNREKAPITVDNFLKYTNDGFYDGLIFHRVIDGFMIQGGGFYPDMTQKSPTYPGIENEADNGLMNVRGTIAMARTSDPDSATCQFFINTVDNSADSGKSGHLDPGGVDSSGYAVFGTVVVGMDVVDDIEKVSTHTENGKGDVPVEDVVIEWVKTSLPDGGDDDDGTGDDDDNDDGDDDGGDQDPVMTKKPNPPRNLQAKAGDGHVELSWTTPVDNGAPAIYEYDIYRSSSVGEWKQLAYVSGDVNTYTDESAENGVTYYYVVVAVNAFDQSEYSSDAKAVPELASEESPGFSMVLVLGTLLLVASLSLRNRK